MRTIQAFEAPDGRRFFDEREARNHERREDFGKQIDAAVSTNSQFGKLDRTLLIDYFMEYGIVVGKIAEAPIAASGSAYVARPRSVV